MLFSGGVMPYTLTITNGTLNIGPFAVTSGWQLGGLCAGNYTITLIDANNDTCFANTTIASLPVPVANFNVTNASCSVCNDGCITLNSITGGTPPFTFLWSDGSTAQGICFLTPAIYTCTIIDANGCTAIDTILVGVGSNGYYTLTGLMYYDLNSNGIQDSGEPGLGNQQAVINPGSATAVSDGAGNYGVVVAPGTYDITYLPTPGWHITSSPSSYNQTVATASISGNDFGVFPDSTYGSADIFLTSGFPRCLTNVPYNLSIYNSGYTILDGTFSFTHDPTMTYVNSSVTPTSQLGNTLNYSFTNLFPGQYLTIVVNMTEPAAGTGLFNYLSVQATDIFSNQFVINKSLQQTVSCSYDPNDKQVYPSGIGPLNYVAMDEWLTYQVRFQNTGNDTAFTVVILDTLDAALDVNTFALIGSSHPVFASIRNNNEVSFVFENILLPDSIVDEPASHGYVLYRIQGISSNPDPTSVNNTAYIYFDLDSPVQTNTTLTTFSDNFLSISEYNSQNIFELFPNPMNETATLKLKVANGMAYRIALLDITGRMLNQPGEMKNGIYSIHKGSLKAGVYVLEATPVGNGQTVRMHLVIR